MIDLGAPIEIVQEYSSKYIGVLVTISFGGKCCCQRCAPNHVTGITAELDWFAAHVGEVTVNSERQPLARGKSAEVQRYLSRGAGWCARTDHWTSRSSHMHPFHHRT